MIRHIKPKADPYELHKHFAWWPVKAIGADRVEYRVWWEWIHRQKYVVYGGSVTEFYLTHEDLDRIGRPRHAYNPF